MKWFILLSVIWLLPCAWAERAPTEAEIAFNDGRYHDVARALTTATDANALALQARALLAEAISKPEPPLSSELIEAAEIKASEAIAADPTHIEGRLQLAIALSLKARPLSNATAMRKGYGGKAKRLVESVLEDDPTNHYAHGFMSIWHLEVMHRGGRFGGSMMGASVNKARFHYEQVQITGSHDPAAHWQYARALASLNAKRYKDEVMSVLARAIDAPNKTKLERVMQARAEKLKSIFLTETPMTAMKTAQKML